MTKRTGLGQYMIIAGYDLSGDIGSVSGLKKSFAEQNVTGLTKSALERLTLIEDGEVSFANYYNPETVAANIVGLHAVLKNLPDADRLASLLFSATRGDVTASITGKQLNYDLERGDDGALNGGAINVKGSGFGLEYGVSLTAGKESVVGTIESGAMTIGVTNATKTYTRTGGISFITQGFLAGDRVTIAGFVDGASNGLKTLVTVTSTTLIVAEAVGVDEAGTGDESVSLTSRSLASVNNGAASTNGASFFLHILNIVGAANKDISVLVEQSSDNGVTDPWATLVSFTNVNVSGMPAAERGSVTGNVEQYLRIRVATVDGYTSAIIAVTANRK